jgi:transposase
VLVEGHTQREAARQFHMSRNTIAKLLAEPAEGGGSERRYARQQAPTAPVSAAALPHIRGWLKENAWLQRWKPKQQWTAKRMWLELRRLDIPAGESTVRQLVRRERERTQQERRPTYVPLEFGPGERAEFDFGEAAVEVHGQLCSVPFLVGRLRFSGAMFLEVFPTQRQEAFLLGPAPCLRVVGRRAAQRRLRQPQSRSRADPRRPQPQRARALRALPQCLPL